MAVWRPIITTSSPGASRIAVFASDSSDAAQWLEVGRCDQRFAVQAALLGIAHAPVNPTVETAQVRGEFGRTLRLGLRRPVQDILL